ncbi:MAG: four helix bundle protein [Candidatus Taylorbacteria bacterium]|nr:four helix bundle protein [Candidatus Taylorbacteria bacterium]
MTNQIQSSKSKNIKAYDLSERTAIFGESVIDFVRYLGVGTINRPIISQLIRSSTSIGANYMEADGAESKKDFIHKIAICKKESKETMHWFRMLAKANPEVKDKCRLHWKEAHELALIFSAICKK